MPETFTSFHLGSFPVTAKVITSGDTLRLSVAVSGVKLIDNQEHSTEIIPTIRQGMESPEDRLKHLAIDRLMLSLLDKAI